MNPVFLNSAIVRAPEALVLRGGRWRMLNLKIRFGIWRNRQYGWMLIDTGYTDRITSGAGRGAALRFYDIMLRPRLIEPNAPRKALAECGVRPEDLGAILLTHFHADHVAGLRDFPGAPIIASGAGWDAVSAMSRRQKLRHAIFPDLLPEDLEQRMLRIEEFPVAELPFDLGRGFDLFGDGACLAVSLPGHAIGHFGLLWPQLDPPLLYAADTQWLWAAIAERRPPAGVARLIYHDEAAAMESLERVRAFAHAGGAVLLAHDPADGPYRFEAP